MPDDVRLQKLKKLLEITNEGLTREEFIDSFKKAYNHILETEVKLLKKVSKALDDVKSLQNTQNKASEADLRALKETTGETIDSALKEQENALNFIKDKVRKLKNGSDGMAGRDGVDGKDGKDADEDKIFNRLVKKIPREDNKELKALKEEVKVLRRMKRGGGTSAMGVAQAFKWILKTEAPSGDIDGANKAYTVSSDIFAVLAFSLNGEVIAELPNYTVAGKTITFSVALPAAYSGKDFEIKYI